MNIIEPIGKYLHCFNNYNYSIGFNLTKAASEKLLEGAVSISKQNGIKILSGLLSLYTLFEFSKLINITEISSLDKIRKNKTSSPIPDSITENNAAAGAAAPRSHSCKVVKTRKYETWEDFLDEAEESKKTEHDKIIAETKDTFLQMERIGNRHNGLTCNINKSKPYVSTQTFEDCMDKILESRKT